MNRAHTARVITVQRIGKLCAMDLQSDQKWALSVRTCIRACTVVVQSDTMVAAVHRCCSVPPWRRTLPDQRKDFGQSMDWDATRMPWCCPFCHQVGRWPSRRRQGSVLERGRNFFRPLAEACEILRMTRTTALVLKIFVRHTNCECSAGFPGCSWVVNVLRIRPYSNVYIHT
jgi:hypothetical protein